MSTITDDMEIEQSQKDGAGLAHATCPTCGGTGDGPSPGETCPTCHGVGEFDNIAFDLFSLGYLKGICEELNAEWFNGDVEGHLRDRYREHLRRVEEAGR